VAAARSRGGNEALQAAWEDFGRSELYEAPDEQELKDLRDPRSRRRGEHTQRLRLERGWLQLQRKMAAEQQTNATAHAEAQAEAAAEATAAEGEAAARSPAVPMNVDPPAAHDTRLTVGGQVMIDGLASRPELNGCVGTIVTSVQESGRYGVAIGDAVLALRPERLTPATAAAAGGGSVRSGDGCSNAAAAAEAPFAFLRQHVHTAQCNHTEEGQRADSSSSGSASSCIDPHERAALRLPKSLREVSPLGCFRSWDELMDYLEIPQPEDACLHHTRCTLGANATAAWVDSLEPFCCAGVPVVCTNGIPKYLPHMMDATSERPHATLCHLVDWVFSSMHHWKLKVRVGRQCTDCATKLLSAGCPLPIVSAHDFDRIREAHEIECRDMTPDNYLLRLMAEIEM
jgi:hypothetical protein